MTINKSIDAQDLNRMSLRESQSCCIETFLHFTNQAFYTLPVIVAASHCVRQAARQTANHNIHRAFQFYSVDFTRSSTSIINRYYS